MFTRHLSTSLLTLGALTGLLFALLAGFLVSAAPAAHAGARQQVQRTSNVILLHQVTLSETSINGPALSSILDNFEGIHFNTAIGWTGTDSLHHLNVISSSDDPANGVVHFGNKVTLHETSFTRPAIQVTGGGLGFTVIAWTGTDPAHTLNVLEVYSTGTVVRKLTLWGETSIAAPALIAWKGGFVLAWTGTDANHSLNVLPLTVELQRGAQTVLPQFSSMAGPNLSVFSNATTTRLVLNWTTKSLHLNQAYSTDGVHFTSALGPGGTPQLSTIAPSSFYHESEGAPSYWMAWTGTDPAHHVNLQWTTNWPQWPDPATTKTVLGQTALGGSQIAFNDGFVLAWTGTDSLHHLNVAEFELR
jgi:hypothetical protein